MARPRKETKEPDMDRVRGLVKAAYNEICMPRPENDYGGLIYAEKCGYLERVLGELLVELGLTP